ncbi:solute carrier family 35 member G1-like [Strongylocentrotus purpuratus]|uniref:Solute carrier family 35 member G1 n=1 Tax=Strongylocentrotus purpuratus TaxID=7668 RepID=A0A7M7NAX8_STRPU|nr:solute carrier family 35 member G1-like [Strongylocentrotus purpuratus]
MFKRRRADCQKRHDDIDYHDVNVKEITTGNGSVRSDSIAPPSVSSWKLILGTLHHHRGVIWAVLSVFVATALSLCIKLLTVAIAFFSLLTVIAVNLVVQPPFIFGGGDIGNLTGILCATVGAVVMAGATIILRFMQILRIDAHAIIFIYGFIAMFCSCAVTTALGEWTTPHCGIDRWFVLGMAVSGFLEQVTVTLALKTEPALVVSIIRTNDIFLAFAFDFLIFHIVPNAWTVVGAILVVGSAIGMTISANYELKKQMQVEKEEEEEEEEASFENRDDHLSRI